MLWMIIFFLSFKGFSSSSQEFQIPRSIYDSIKKTYNLDQTEIKPQMTDVLVEFKTSKGYFQLPVGYTLENLDISQYLPLSDKTFTFQVSTPYSSNSSDTVVYFISRYKPFKRSENSKEEYGYPCGTVYKISNRVNSFLNAPPLTLSSYEREYASLIGGDYLILHKEGSHKMRISYFKIRDTRWTHELCLMP